MTADINEGPTVPLEPWEKEILVRHRWGQHGDAAIRELERLRELWAAAQPLGGSAQAVLEQIVALEICNWNLEASILALCQAIGDQSPTKLPIGHLRSVSEARWRTVWAYYLALRAWLHHEGGSGYPSLLALCDPEEAIQRHLLELLGERNALKELYVERFCLLLEFWLGGMPSPSSARSRAHKAAVSALEEEIARLDPRGRILAALKDDGDGKLQPCHHKALRRYDIVLSSIGAGEWRAAMPIRGTDGFARAAALEEYLAPIESWVASTDRGPAHDALGEEIHRRLGQVDRAKVFLTAFLVSVLRAQGLAARRRAESRVALGADG